MTAMKPDQPLSLSVTHPVESMEALLRERLLRSPHRMDAASKCRAADASAPHCGGSIDYRDRPLSACEGTARVAAHGAQRQRLRLLVHEALVLLERIEAEDAVETAASSGPFN